MRRAAGALRWLVSIASLTFALLAAGNTQAGNTPESVESSLTHVTATLIPDARQALAQIDGTPRRLLALRGYLRAGDSLASRWSWTEAQIEAYEQSAQHAQMLAEIKKVSARFEQLNPGYTLYANSQVRSLGVQLERWNKNRTVGRLADELFAATRSHLAQVSDVSDAMAGKELPQFLLNWRPSVAIPLAAPGLSLHGRLRALDFQVYAGGHVVAGPDTSTVASVWKAQGWAQKLAAAIADSSDRFSGPLAVPNEPWHFEYVPQPVEQPARSTQ
jgi:hypothetical protein